MSKNVPRLTLLLTCCFIWLLACAWLVLPQGSPHAAASVFQPEASPSPNATVTAPPTPSPSPAPSPSPTPTPIPSPSPTPTPSPSSSPSPSPNPTPSVTPTATATPTTIGNSATPPQNGGKATGTVLSIVLALIGLLLTVLGIVLYSFYARQQRIAQGG